MIAQTAKTGARLVYLSNPDNPMGTWHSAEVIQTMIDTVPDHALLLLDEAYVEFAPEGTVPPVDPGNSQVLRFRTFSKAYGLAGARVGYVIGAAETIAAFDRIKNHFGLNRLAQAGALAALRDQDWLNQMRAKVAKSREEISRIALDNGLSPLPSATNFVTLDCGRDGDYARAILAALIRRGIFVRMPFVAPQDRCIRIGTGPSSEISEFAAALPGAMIDAQG